MTVTSSDDDPAVLRMAAVIGRALRDPEVRRDVGHLVTGESDRRDHHLDQLAEELSGYELRWQREGDSDG